MHALGCQLADHLAERRVLAADRRHVVNADLGEPADVAHGIVAALGQTSTKAAMTTTRAIFNMRWSSRDGQTSCMDTILDSRAWP